MGSAAKPLDILVVSDLWPPPFIGGYEVGAAEARDAAAVPSRSSYSGRIRGRRPPR